VLKALYKALCEPIRFWTVRRRSTDLKAQLSSEFDRLPTCVLRAVVAQPLDRLGKLFNASEPAFDGLQHEIPNLLASEAICRRVGCDYFSVAAINNKGNSDKISVPAADMEYITRIAHVTRQSDYFAVVSSSWFWAEPFQKKILFTHNAVNFFAIDSSDAIVPKLSIQNCGDAGIAIAGALITDSSNSFF
jgi:hypothetical protein